jgi:hypothetical protein
MVQVEPSCWWKDTVPRADIDNRVRAKDDWFDQSSRCWTAGSDDDPESGCCWDLPAMALEPEEPTIDSLSLGVLLVGANGRILILNAAAESILEREDGLLRRSDRLAANRPFEAAMLSREVARALSPGLRNAGPSYTISTVSRPSGMLPYLLLIAPLEGRLLGASDTESAALVAIEDPEMPIPDLAEQLRTAFEIAEGGAEVAAQLMETHGLGGSEDRHGARIRAIRGLVQAMMGDPGPSVRKPPRG